MALLWEQAAPLSVETLPTWLTAEDMLLYRELPLREPAPCSAAEWDAYLSQLDELAEIGLIVEGPDDMATSKLARVYIEAPKLVDIFSIGLYRGESPVSLRPYEGIQNPILTRECVSDVPATFVADPFLVIESGNWYLFFEVMNWRTNKGEIGLATSTDGIAWSYQKIVLAEPFHLSYPHVFKWGGQYFMTPESFQAGEVRLYRADPFPTHWVYAGTLIHGKYLADPTIFRHADQWWLFVDTSPKGGHDTLSLFVANDISGPWRQHPQSPIVTGDPHSARPAGPVVCWNNRLFRFAQNSVPWYGTDVRVFEVTELGKEQYQEQPVGAMPLLGPGTDHWNAGGMHHVSLHELQSGTWLAYVDGWARMQTAGHEPTSDKPNRDTDTR